MLCERENIGEYKAVAGDGFADLNRDGMLKHRSRKAEGVEFAVLAARVNGGRQFGKQTLVVQASRKRWGKLFGVNGGQRGAQAARKHFFGEGFGVVPRAPEGEDGLNARACHHAFAVGADVFEEEVAKSNVGHAFAAGAFDDGAHSCFVFFVGAGEGQRHRPERNARRFRLFFHQFHADAVHGDAVVGLVEGGEQADDFHSGLLADGVERPGAVFA